MGLQSLFYWGNKNGNFGLYIHNSPDEFLLKLKDHLSHTLSDVPNFYRLSLSAMNKYCLKNTAVLFQDNLDDDSNFKYFRWYSLALDIIESNIFKPAIVKAKRTAPPNTCKISFLNKGVKLINVPHIFHDLSVKAFLPTDIKFDDPTAVYSLRSKLGSNYLVLINLFLI